MRIILRATWQKTHSFPDQKRIISPNSLIVRVTKKLSKDFSRTEIRILGALSRLDEYLLNPLIQGHSGSTPETSRNALGTHEGANEDNYERDPHPEARVSQSQFTQASGADDDYDTIADHGKIWGKDSLI